MKGEAVIDAPDVSVGVEQAVTAFAIAVLDDHAKGGHGAEAFGPRGHQGEVMLPKVGGDELLERAGSHGAVGAIDGQRHDLPVERRADQVSRYLALSERAVGKIIEGR